jgi:hypothetical protein
MLRVALGKAALLLSLLVVFGVNASESTKVVQTKYSGTVDLSGYDCRAVSSSWVHQACYDIKSRKLVLLLNDTYYMYCSVPAMIIEHLLIATSKGQFFNAVIKARYKC